MKIKTSLEIANDLHNNKELLMRKSKNKWVSVESLKEILKGENMYFEMGICKECGDLMLKKGDKKVCSCKKE